MAVMFDQPKNILVVEDNDKDRELIVHALTSHEIANHVIAVKNGHEALTYLNQRRHFGDAHSHLSLVIIDLDLPDAHGLEILKKLRTELELRNVPVMILTGSASALDAAAARQLGANAYVVKPTQWEDMQALVRSSAIFWAQQESSAA